MNCEDLDLRELELTNKKTGEIIDLNILFVKDGGSFNKVFLSELAGMIGCTGDGSHNVLEWIFKVKNNKNEIFGTQREIAESVGVSLFTVSKVFKALSSNDYLKLKRSGAYILNPKVMHYGGAGNNMAILKVWRGIS